MPEFTPQEIDEYRLQQEIRRMTATREEELANDRNHSGCPLAQGPRQKSKPGYVSLQPVTGGSGFKAVAYSDT